MKIQVPTDLFNFFPHSLPRHSLNVSPEKENIPIEVIFVFVCRNFVATLVEIYE